MTQPPRKLALLISSFLPNLGGMEVGLHNIAIRVQKMGWEPVVIAPHPHVKALKNAEWKLPYQVEALPPKIWGIIERWPWIGFKITDIALARLQQKHRFDFWHVTMGYPAGCAMVHFAEQSKSDIQYLIRCAGEDIQKRPDIDYGMRLNPKLDQIITHYLARAQRLVAITKSVRGEYKAMNIADDVIYDIPNGVPLKNFQIEINREKIREKYGVSKSDFVILTVGRNHPKKNYKKLIEVARLLKEKGISGFKIMFIGKGCPDLQSYADELGILDHVILLNQFSAETSTSQDKLNLPAKSLVEIYKAADLFAFPSLTETFGIAIVEAMSAGLPVIVGDSDGCRDIVQNGEWGIICNPHNANDLSMKIQNMINNAKLREIYKEKSLKRAESFDWDHVVKQYISVYEEKI